MSITVDVINPATLSVSHAWVDPKPFRAWSTFLISQSGLPWRALAIAADVPQSMMRRLLSRNLAQAQIRRIRAVDGRRLLALTPDVIVQRGHARVPAVVTSYLVWMLSLYFPVRSVAGFLDVSPAEVYRLLDRPQWCPTRLQWRAQAAAPAHRRIDESDSLAALAAAAQVFFSRRPPAGQSHPKGSAPLPLSKVADSSSLVA